MIFDNLKAFIRHGKQANDLRRKEDSESTTGISNLPSLDFDDLQIGEDRINNTFNASNYEHVASQIVEQERLDKQNSGKYANLENYEVMEQMGEGAFSIVYKARHIPTNKFVAIKILRKFQMDSNQKQAVLKEVTIMRQLDHPNIVKFIEFIDSPNYYYIVQELAVGGEIFTAIVKYTYLSEDLSRHAIIQLANAIRYLHEEVGVVHRDIKPENLLYNPIEFRPSLDPRAKLRKSDDPQTKLDEGEFISGLGGGQIGEVKLADFGLSKQIWEHNTKTPCGTVGYTAPEIVKDENYSKEVDMWAIGCVMYTLLCGFPPFYDERIETLTEKVARGEFTFLSPWWDEISKEAKYCVSKLLTVDPMQRYTIDDLLNDPWINQKVKEDEHRQDRRVSNAAKQKSNQHPLHKAQVDYSGMYSPAAIAMRDAFDISSAVHRNAEEAALSRKYGARFDKVTEEDEMEIEQTDSMGQVVSDPSKFQPKTQDKAFDLNLKGASILERRMNKGVALKI